MNSVIANLVNHPASELFPMMDAAELQKLADDIRENGLLEPVVIYHEQVLDGRNRLAACNLAEIMPRFVEVNGDLPSPALYVISKNLHRRHLTTGQRGAIAAEVAPLLADEAKQRQVAAGTANITGKSRPIGHDYEAKGSTRRLAAEALQVGEGTVQRAIEVKEADPALFEKVKSGEVKVAEARRQLPPRPSQPSRPGVRKDKTAPYEPTTPGQVKKAETQKDRMVNALSTITGLCRGLAELDAPMAFSVCDADERGTWIEKARDLAKQLRAFAAKLEGANVKQA